MSVVIMTFLEHVSVVATASITCISESRPEQFGVSMLVRGRSPPPWPQMGGQGGRSFSFGGLRTPTWARPENKEVLGGALGGAQGRFGGPQRNFEIVEKTLVFFTF